MLYIRRDSKEYYQQHFKDRLLERYGITITDHEYDELCNQPLNLLYKLGPNKRFGTISIGEHVVYVVRCNASKLLNTALVGCSDLPLPTAYRRAGKTRQEFNDDFDNTIEKIKKLEQWLRMKKDKKYFFTKKPFGLPDWMYGAAYSLTNDFQHDFMNRVVKALCRDIRTSKIMSNE